MNEYNFAAQYQQDPQPPSGLIVRRAWLKFYSEEEKPSVGLRPPSVRSHTAQSHPD